MSKKRKKSRFTKTDVNTICELQRKIDAYESYIIGLYGLVQHRSAKKYIVILRGTELDDWVNGCHNMLMELIEEAEQVKKICNVESEEFQQLLSKWHEKHSKVREE